MNFIFYGKEYQMRPPRTRRLLFSCFEVSGDAVMCVEVMFSTVLS